MKGREEVQKVPPLKILIDKQKSPRYCIQQVDGACSFFEEDSDLSFCEENILQSDDDDGNWIIQSDDNPRAEVEFVTPVTPGGSVKFLPAV